MARKKKTVLDTLRTLDRFGNPKKAKSAKKAAAKKKPAKRGGAKVRKPKKETPAQARRRLKPAAAKFQLGNRPMGKTAKKREG